MAETSPISSPNAEARPGTSPIDLPLLVETHADTSGNALMGFLVATRDAIQAGLGAISDPGDDAAWRDPLAGVLPHALQVGGDRLVDATNTALEAEDGSAMRAALFAWAAQAHTTLAALDLMIDICLVLGRAPNGQPIRPDAHDTGTADTAEDDPFTS